MCYAGQRSSLLMELGLAPGWGGAGRPDTSVQVVRTYSSDNRQVKPEKSDASAPSAREATVR